MKVRLTSSAASDLRQINVYIAADSPSRARQFVKKIIQACQGLTDAPRRGREVSSLGPGVRGLVFGSYLILYQIEPREVVVLRVVHGMRDLDDVEV